MSHVKWAGGPTRTNPLDAGLSALVCLAARRPHAPPAGGTFKWKPTDSTLVFHDVDGKRSEKWCEEASGSRRLRRGGRRVSPAPPPLGSLSQRVLPSLS